jgi:hypothetical protein
VVERGGPELLGRGDPGRSDARVGRIYAARRSQTPTPRDLSVAQTAEATRVLEIKASASSRSILPMQLQIGDRYTDETGEWEILSQPFTLAARRSFMLGCRRLESLRSPQGGAGALMKRWP